MDSRVMSKPDFKRAIILLMLTAAGDAAAQAPRVEVKVAAPAPEIVWRYASPGMSCAADDFSDVAVRPFLVNGARAGTYRVLWFAANSRGYFASETPGPDRTPGDITLAHFERRAGCDRWLRSKPYAESTPASYDTGLWMAAPFTADGTNVYALVHNEFHGEWTTNDRWCTRHEPEIYLPCNYWNLVSAFSTDAGRSFALRKISPNENAPAIAVAEPYAPDRVPLHQVPQGMVAQSNMIERDGFVYVLVQQFGTTALVPANENGGVCLFRAVLPLNPATTWRGWAGRADGWIDMPASYPAAPRPPPCAKVLPGAFRFTWSYNPALQQFIMIGTVSDPSFGPACPAADPTVGDDADMAFVYTTATADLANGQFTVVTPQTCLLRINWLNGWGRSWPGKIGSSYPSLLDPTSPMLKPNGGTDLNFQFSGAQPYLYYTRLNSYARTGNLRDRDVVRWKLSVTPAAAALSR
jgi:hypothetical protein